MLRVRRRNLSTLIVLSRDPPSRGRAGPLFCARIGRPGSKTGRLESSLPRTTMHTHYWTHARWRKSALTRSISDRHAALARLRQERQKEAGEGANSGDKISANTLPLSCPFRAHALVHAPARERHHQLDPPFASQLAPASCGKRRFVGRKRVANARVSKWAPGAGLPSLATLTSSLKTSSHTHKDIYIDIFMGPEVYAALLAPF